MEDRKILGWRRSQNDSDDAKRDSIISELDSAFSPDGGRLINLRTGIFLTALFLCFIAAHVLAIAQWNFNSLASVFADAETWKFFSNTVVSLMASLIAAIVYTSMQNRGTERRLTLIRSLADRTLLQSLLSDLYHFQRRHLENYNVSLELRKSSNPDILICQISYSYTVINKVNPSLLFRFHRIRTEKEAEEVRERTRSIAADAAYYNYEFQYTLDERSMHAILPEEELTQFYKIRSLSVHGQPTQLRPKGGRDLELEATVPDLPSGQHRMPLTYTVEFPMELDSFASVLLELPTTDITCRFSYRDVKDLIDVGTADLLGSRVPVEPVDNQLGEIVFTHTRWMFPRSGLTFIWSRKMAAKDTGPQQPTPEEPAPKIAPPK
jgi:hypothetical protein